MIGRFVDVTADLARVEVRHEGRLVAAHDRVWARGMTITDPAHVAAAKVLREQYQQPRPAPDPPRRRWCGTWPTTTAPSASSTRPDRRRPTMGGGVMAATKTKRDASEALKQSTYLAVGVEGTPDHRGSRPAGRPRPRRRLDPRGVPRRGARP